MLKGIRRLWSENITNELKTKFAVLGLGCSYIYTTGLMLYIKVVNKTTDDSNNIQGPVAQLFSSYFISHLSPLLISAFVKNDCMSNIYKNLNSDTNLRQQIITYSALLKVATNRQAVKHIANNLDGTSDSLLSSPGFRSIYNDILHLRRSKEANGDAQNLEFLFGMKLKTLECMLRNIEPERRKIPIKYLRELVNTTKVYESLTTKRSISNVLSLFLENTDNIKAIIDEEYKDYPTRDDYILSYLYSIELKSKSIATVASEKFPIVALHAGCIDAINKTVDGVLLPSPLVPSVYRLWNSYRREITSLILTTEISYCYALIRSLLSPSVFGSSRLDTFQSSMKQGWYTTRGLLMLQLLFYGQDKVIQSERYFNNDNFMRLQLDCIMRNVHETKIPLYTAIITNNPDMNNYRRCQYQPNATQ